MDNRVGSIFSRVKSDNEDTVTDLLCHLMKDKFMRDAVLVSIGVDRAYVDEISPEMIHSWKALGDGTKPDIAIGNSSSTPVVIIENKIDKGRGLESSQVTSYPDAVELSGSPHKKVIYLVPRDYRKNEENARKIEHAQDTYGNLVAVKYWEDLLKEITELGLANVNALVTEIVGYIKNTIEPFEVEHVNLDAEEAVMLYEKESFHRGVRLLRDLWQVFLPAMVILWEEVQDKSSPDFLWAHNDNYTDDSSLDPSVWGKFWRFQSSAPCIFVGFDFEFPPKENSQTQFGPVVRIDKEVLSEKGVKAASKQEPISTDKYYYFPLSKYTVLKTENSMKLAREVADILFTCLGVKLFE